MTRRRPPTGLTAMQSIPLSGMVMVTVPQDMVSMIAAKAVNMVKQMNIPPLGAVQNMSHLCARTAARRRLSHARDFYSALDVRCWVSCR